jgi:hypothetical protein
VAKLRAVYRLLKTIFKDVSLLYRKKRQRKYKVVVAVDNLQYVLCSFVFSNTILWSHDFVTLDQAYSSNWCQRIIRELTRFFLLRNKKIVIQDDERYELFVKTHLRDIDGELDPFYLPVSLKDEEADVVLTEKSHEKLSILQIGGINSFRSNSDKLIRHFQDNSEKYQLRLHGFFFNEIRELLETVEKVPEVSTDVPPEDISAIVRKSDVGFISYNCSNSNFYNIKNASGQFAEFLKCGKPVIVLGNTNLCAYVNETNVGVGISDFDELSSAIITVVDNYEIFCQNSRQLFEQKYDINLYLKHLKGWIEENG